MNVPAAAVHHCGHSLCATVTGLAAKRQAQRLCADMIIITLNQFQHSRLFNQHVSVGKFKVQFICNSCAPCSLTAIARHPLDLGGRHEMSLPRQAGTKVHRTVGQPVI